MNRHVLSRLKERVQPRLDATSGTGTLTTEEHDAIFALFEVVTADERYPADRLRRFVDELTSTAPGYLKEFRSAVGVLERATRRRSFAGPFASLSIAERDAVLRSVLRPYPHPRSERRIRRKLRLTSENLDVVLAAREARRLRVHVVRELLGHYYTSELGWALVDYKGYPGRSRAEIDPCEVRAVHARDDELVLEMSDGSFERLEPDRLRADPGGSGLAVLVKGGRQLARFSRAAYYTLAERLEDADAGPVLKIGDRAYEVLR